MRFSFDYVNILFAPLTVDRDSKSAVAKALNLAATTSYENKLIFEQNFRACFISEKGRNATRTTRRIREVHGDDAVARCWFYFVTLRRRARGREIVRVRVNRPLTASCYFFAFRAFRQKCQHCPLLQNTLYETAGGRLFFFKATPLPRSNLKKSLTLFQLLHKFFIMILLPIIIILSNNGNSPTTKETKDGDAHSCLRRRCKCTIYSTELFHHLEVEKERRRRNTRESISGEFRVGTKPRVEREIARRECISDEKAMKKR